MMAAAAVPLCLLGAAPADRPAPGSEAPAGEEWPIFRGDTHLTGVARGALPSSLDRLWTFQAGGGIESSAAVAQGSVFFGSLDGRLYCVAIGSGELKWTYEGGAPIKSSPSIFDDTVYFGDEKGVFHAVKAKDGKRRFAFQSDAAIVSSATVASGNVIFGSNDNNLYALSVATGTLAWKLATGSYVYGTPALAGDPREPAIVSAGCDGYLRVVRARDGAEIKKLELGAYVGASPAVDGGRAFVGTFENEVLGIDLQTPKIIWRYEHPERKFPYYSSAAVSGSVVVVGGRDKMVHALDAATGRSLWIMSARAKVDSSPVIVGERVFTATTGGDIMALNLATGELVWQFETGSSITASPAVAAGRLLIGTTDGVMYAFGGK